MLPANREEGATTVEARCLSLSGERLTPAMQRILAALWSRSPLSVREIAHQACVALTTLEGGDYLKKMRRLGLIRVEGWLKNHNGFTTPLYAPGSGPDCPRPKFMTEDRDSRGMARIVAVLKSHDHLDYREIAGIAGISANTIKNARYMESLLAQGRVHISGWRRNRRGGPCPLYSAGDGDNAARPSSLTRQEIMGRYRERQKVLSGVAISLEGQLKSMLGGRR